MEIPLPLNDRLGRAELLGRILVLHWNDGHRGELPLEIVRRGCPCATCGSGRTEHRSALHVLPPSDSTEVRAIQAVGLYALQLFWKDGHDSGIYSFDLLRDLCRCPHCAGKGDS